MNLDISSSKVLNNQFIKNFVREIKKVLGNMENIKLSNEEEIEFSQKEFEIYRAREMKNLESDFDKAVKKITHKKGKTND